MIKLFSYQGRLYKFAKILKKGNKVTFWCNWCQSWLPCATLEDELISKGKKF